MTTQRGEIEVQHCGLWGVKPQPQDKALHQVDRSSVMIDEMIMRGGWSFSMMLGLIVPFYDIGFISAGSWARARKVPGFQQCDSMIVVPCFDCISRKNLRPCKFK